MSSLLSLPNLRFVISLGRVERTDRKHTENLMVQVIGDSDDCSKTFQGTSLSTHYLCFISDPPWEDGVALSLPLLAVDHGLVPQHPWTLFPLSSQNYYAKLRYPNDLKFLVPNIIQWWSVLLPLLSRHRNNPYGEIWGWNSNVLHNYGWCGYPNFL